MDIKKILGYGFFSFFAIIGAIALFSGTDNNLVDNSSVSLPTLTVPKETATETGVAEKTEVQSVSYSFEGGEHEGEVKDEPVFSSTDDEAIYPLYASDAVRWGRKMPGMVVESRGNDDVTKQAELGYCEFQLRPNGDFRYYGVEFLQSFVTEGEYVVEDGIITFYNHRFVKGKSPSGLVDYKFKFDSSGSSGQAIVDLESENGISLHRYEEGLYCAKKGYRQMPTKSFVLSTLVAEQTELKGNCREHRKRLESQMENLSSETRKEGEGSNWYRTLPASQKECPDCKQGYYFDFSNNIVECGYCDG